jgi:Starch-binding associating with outer membrane
MKNIFKTLALIITTTFVISCSNDYFDVNTPGNAIDPNKATLKDVLSPAIKSTMSAQYSAATNVCQVDQHISSAFGDQGVDNQYQNGLDNVWFNVYVGSLSKIKQVEDKAIASNASHYLGIAQVLKAINIGLVTDLYGDVPYTEASLGGANLTPKYDSQQSIYIEIDRLLAAAIANFSAPNTSALTPGNEDLIYAGDISKWLKAAYTFRARYQIHLAEVNGNASYTAALSSLANGFTSNADDFQLRYNSINLNPWHASQLGLATGNFSYFVSKHLISYMNGSQFPYTTVTMDPRLPIIVDIRNYPSYLTSPTNPNPMVVANYVGGTNGQGGAGGANSRIGIDKFYSKNDSPLVILSYSEAKFMEAEARFISGGGSPTSVGTSATAYAAYFAGINANCGKLNVAATDKTAFLADTSIDKGAAALSLKDIMRQKFIALFLNPETFNDYRRYNFSTNVFKNLTLPTAADPLNGGNWIRRFVYSSDERNTNNTNYSSNFKTMTTPVWWDR